MAINKKLIHFKNKQNFDNEVANGNILDTSIVFIQDSKEISTHGTVYKTVNWSILEPQLFPMYLTTEQVHDEYRKRDADEQSLALLEYFNKNKDQNNGLNLEALGLVLYIDEYLVNRMFIPAPGTYINLSLLNYPSGWVHYLQPDGSIKFTKV